MPDSFEHPGDGLVDRQVRGIEQLGIRAFLQGRNRSRAVARITLTEILQKGINVSRHSFVDQLFMASLGARFGCCGEKDLELGVWEDHRSHVPPLGNQARRLLIGALAPE